MYFLTNMQSCISAFQLASHVYKDPDAGRQRRRALPSSLNISKVGPVQSRAVLAVGTGM